MDAMIKDIDEFLYNEKEESVFIKQLSEKYCLNDFVMSDNNIKSFLAKKRESAFRELYWGIFNYREREICFYDDIVENRLAREYSDFAWNLLEDGGDRNKVTYFIAYHYLTMLKQVALILSNKEVSFSKQYEEKIYNINRKYGYNHHAIKHHSLMEYLLNHEKVCGIEIELQDEFMLLLNAFLFQYKIIFSTEMIFSTMREPEMKKVIESLVFIE